ncbi:DUF2187 family protein [Lysinibacillus sp. 54212]|uniref:DUF2187 family protein n=1 Tax=Lysinibacillus sp. 54212 TaxID=3119829 RepID=UPI002FC8F544
MTLKKAKTADNIVFHRFNQPIEGKVLKHYENSVLVKIHPEFYAKLIDEIPNDYTVVNHKNYKILY